MKSPGRWLSPPRSAFAGFRYPGRDRGGRPVVPGTTSLTATLGELLVERGVEADHVTIFRQVQRSTPLLAEAVRFCRHAPGDRWYADETYVKVNGVWWYVYRAVNQDGQVVAVLVSARRDPPVLRRAMARLKVRPTSMAIDAHRCTRRYSTS